MDGNHLGRDHSDWTRISVQFAENLDTGRMNAVNREEMGKGGGGC